jgi:hypothetical protein
LELKDVRRLAATTLLSIYFQNDLRGTIGAIGTSKKPLVGA